MRYTRARTARRAEETSDVRRYRGLLTSSVVGSVVVAAAVFWGLGRFAKPTSTSPGAASPGHQEAGLKCVDCHGQERTQDACLGCHSGQTSTRAGHRELLSAGRLTCPDCHQGHDPLSVSFGSDGKVLGEGPSGQRAIRSDSLYRPAVRTRVPLIRARACAACHQLERAVDPAYGCLPAPDAPVSVCFDEHRSAFEASSRTAAWEAAGALARDAAIVQLERRSTSPSGPMLTLGLGFLAALFSFFGLRALGQRARTDFGGPEPASASDRGKLRLPQIDPNTCLGCYACVDACPFDVLEVERFVARVARPDACCGLTLCEQKCPNGSLVMGDGQRVDRRPLLTDQLEVPDAPGLFLAGDLSGLSLIRNAVNQGAAVAHHVADAIEKQGRSRTADGTVHDLVVVGAGPAGLSAALEAQRRKLDCVTLEQWDVLAGIRSFPRHKLVLDAGVESDARASLWLEECTKEQLLSKWLHVAKKRRLPIRAQQRVTQIRPEPFGYRVEVLDDAGVRVEYLARHVLLAMGKRGTPRKLDAEVPEAWQARVHYALVDARPFAERRVLVVGLGDSAMEAAAALAEQPGAKVTIAYRGATFKRGQSKNQHRIQRMAEEGRIELAFNSELREFSEHGVVLQQDGHASTRHFDAVFVLMGSLLPWDFLRSVGVRRRDEA